MAEAILPGTYITVRDEGLISAGSVVSGNIGIVGTASKGPVDTVKIIGSFSEAQEIFGESDPWQGGNQNELTLIRALEQVYNNGGRTVYAVRTATSKTLSKASYQLKDDSNGDLLKLEARTPGTWGKDIKIKISDAEANQKRVELSYGAIQEAYVVESAAALVEAIKTTRKSVLVTATDPAKNKSTALPKNTDKDEGDSFNPGGNGAEAGKQEYQKSLALLENEIVNIVLLAGQDSSGDGMAEVLEGHLKATAEIKRERIGIIGSGFNDGNEVVEHNFNNERVIFTAPGIQVSGKGKPEKDLLPGGYLAASVAGLIASLPVQASPTNKTLKIGGLSTEFNASQLEKLVLNRVLAVEKRDGFRVVKGITTHDGAWKQITTRRIVDYAIYGVRSSCNPYIGKLNNDRVRGAMKATLDAFLTRMVNDEALVGYELAVSATRAQEIAGEAIVTLTLKPTFSIDFIKVTMYLG